MSKGSHERDKLADVHAHGDIEDDSSGGERDLAFLHVPYNGGHTMEKVAAFGNGPQATAMFKQVMLGIADAAPIRAPNGELWGAMYPGMLNMSSVGCPMYLTPPEYWPQDLAQAYFGDKKVFGTLRDPYERLVAFFRGQESRPSDYGGDFSQWFASCDVDSAIRHVLEEYLSASDPFAYACTYLPQVNYFGGEFGNASKFGITEAVDHRRSPLAQNEMLLRHGYDFQIEIADQMHVSGCNEVWSAAFTPYTRDLIRQVYADDFKLICETFGHCEDGDVCPICLPQMCPSNITKAGSPECVGATGM